MPIQRLMDFDVYGYDVLDIWIYTRKFTYQLYNSKWFCVAGSYTNIWPVRIVFSLCYILYIYIVKFKDTGYTTCAFYLALCVSNTYIYPRCTSVQSYAKRETPRVNFNIPLKRRAPTSYQRLQSTTTHIHKQSLNKKKPSRQFITTSSDRKGALKYFFFFFQLKEIKKIKIFFYQTLQISMEQKILDIVELFVCRWNLWQGT